MRASPSLGRISGGQRVCLVLILASLMLTACLGDGGRPQVGATGKTGQTTVASPPSIPPDSSQTSLRPRSSGGATSTPTETQPPSAPGTFGTISPLTTKPAVRTTPTTVATTTTQPSGNTPSLISVSPNSGLPGQTVTLSGSGLFSKNGMITVLFGRVSASVSCPTQTTCQARVPEQPTPGPATTPVTITTDTGTSKAVAFTYR